MGQHAWPATGHSPVPLGSSCPWPCVGVGHTPGRGWVSLGCWCSPGVLTQSGSRGCCGRTHRTALPAGCGWSTTALLPAASPLPHPASTKQVQREEVTWEKATENQNQGMWVVGGKGGGSLKGLCSQQWGGHGAGACPCSLARASSSSHQANHQFTLASVAENQPKNKCIELQLNE